jgi:hypothetical protein
MARFLFEMRAQKKIASFSFKILAQNNWQDLYLNAYTI